MDNQKVWIASDVRSADGRVFELIGVFDSEEKAVAACTMPNHCCFPLELNQTAPAESTIVPNVRWPKLECAGHTAN